MSTFLIAGSAHMNFISQGEHHTLNVTRNGKITISIGGTGHNLAVTLAGMKNDVRLLTALSASPFSNMIQEHLREAGVDPHIKTDDTLPLAGASSHLSPSGELLSSVMGTVVDLASFGDAEILGAMLGADAVVMDTHLSRETMTQVSRIAAEMAIPVYVVVTTEDTAPRVARDDLKAASVFMNGSQFAALRRAVYGEDASLQTIAAHMDTTVVCVDDMEGQITVARAHAVSASGVPSRRRHSVLDRYDAIYAGLLQAHVVEGIAIEEASASSSSLSIAHTVDTMSGFAEAIERRVGRTIAAASTDRLTGLANRAAIEVKLEEEIDRCQRHAGRRAAVAMLDVDHFKSVNDTFGHAAGDQVLQSVAATVSAQLRKYDAPGRWGGEEFICVMPEADLPTAQAVVERVRRAVAAQTGLPRQVTLSAGIAIFREGDAIGTLVERADAALYLAKRSGRNRTKTESDMEPARSPRLVAAG